MANALVAEIADMANIGGMVGQVPAYPPIAEQVLAIGSEVKSAAFNNSTRFIRLYAESACHIAVGEDPTATTSMTKLGAGQTEYFGVRRGYKISVIAGV